MRVQATCRAAATNTISGGLRGFTSPCRKRSARRLEIARLASYERRNTCCAGRPWAGRHVDALEDAPGRCASFSSRFEVDARASQRAFGPPGSVPDGRSAQRRVLGRDQGCHHASEAFELVALSRRDCSRSARLAKTVEEIRRATRITLGERSRWVLVARAGRRGTQWRHSVAADFLAEPLAMMLPAPAA